VPSLAAWCRPIDNDFVGQVDADRDDMPNRQEDSDRDNHADDGHWCPGWG
jgi:hypothetical protein